MELAAWHEVTHLLTSAGEEGLWREQMYFICIGEVFFQTNFPPRLFSLQHLLVV